MIFKVFSAISNVKYIVQSIKSLWGMFSIWNTKRKITKIQKDLDKNNERTIKLIAEQENLATKEERQVALRKQAEGK